MLRTKKQGSVGVDVESFHSDNHPPKYVRKKDQLGTFIEKRSLWTRTAAFGVQNHVDRRAPGLAGAQQVVVQRGEKIEAEGRRWNECIAARVQIVDAGGSDGGGSRERDPRKKVVAAPEIGPKAGVLRFATRQNEESTSSHKLDDKYPATELSTARYFTRGGIHNRRYRRFPIDIDNFWRRMGAGRGG